MLAEGNFVRILRALLHLFGGEGGVIVSHGFCVLFCVVHLIFTLADFCKQQHDEFHCTLQPEK